MDKWMEKKSIQWISANLAVFALITNNWLAQACAKRPVTNRLLVCSPNESDKGNKLA